MNALLARVADRLHGAVALAVVWLVATSPWVVLWRALPENPDFWTLAHVIPGLVLTPLVLIHLPGHLVQGRWREHFPWLGGRIGRTGRELAGLFRGRRPPAGGGGLFATLRGLLLLVVLAAALTGLGWLAADGGRAALAWREAHLWFAHACIVLLVLHVVAALSHLLDFAGD